MISHGISLLSHFPAANLLHRPEGLNARWTTQYSQVNTVVEKQYKNIFSEKYKNNQKMFDF